MLKAPHGFCSEAVVIELKGTWKPPSCGMIHIVLEGAIQVTKGEVYATNCCLIGLKAQSAENNSSCYC